MAIWEDVTLTVNQIKHVYHVGGVDECILSNLSSHGGLVRNPTYFYPLDDAGKLKRSSPQFQHTELECSFKQREMMHGVPASQLSNASTCFFSI